MSAPSASRLMPRVSTSVRDERRAQDADSTRRALLDAAEALFTDHGYAATSLDAIVAGAGVTKGALYHHFSGKTALFDAVLEQVEDEATRTVGAALDGHVDPWARARAGLRAIVAVTQDRGYRRIVVLEGPAVVGHERVREQQQRSTFAAVLDIVGSVMAADGRDLEKNLVQTCARIVFGALAAAGEALAAGTDPEAAAWCAGTTIDLALSICRATADVDPGAWSDGGRPVTS